MIMDKRKELNTVPHTSRLEVISVVVIPFVSSVHIVADDTFRPDLFMSLLTYKMQLKSRECDFSSLLVTHYKSLIMTFLKERVQAGINKINILKIVHSAISTLKVPLQ